MVLMRGNLSALHEDLLVERNADRLTGIAFRQRRIDVEGLDRPDIGPLVRRGEHQMIADFQLPGGNATGDDAASIEFIHVLTGNRSGCSDRAASF